MSKPNDPDGPFPDGSDVGPDDKCVQVTQRRYDPESDGELATEIANALSDARGVEPTEVKSPPLYDVVDVAALEATFFGSDATPDSRQGSGTVAFEYVDEIVEVGSDGWIRIYAHRNG